MEMGLKGLSSVPKKKYNNNSFIEDFISIKKDSKIKKRLSYILASLANLDLYEIIDIYYFKNSMSLLHN
ncbi:hypothetical protein BpHYR1_004140 [Brachionus plicatilis]|uniref:Uncharacterized protein n=1 Tax=Brachionus plicatilis TaxID=10195 RepID=A0A3M7QII0_BRAPC|nr:hypothetical protein BpHYR1_004140 [Brachionus plicatilis]